MKGNPEVQKKILFSLFRKGYIGKKHTPIKNVCGRLSSIPCKQINHEINNLVKKELILPYPTGHDPDVRLNPKKMQIIKKIIDEEIKNIYEF